MKITNYPKTETEAERTIIDLEIPMSETTFLINPTDAQLRSLADDAVRLKSEALFELVELLGESVSEGRTPTNIGEYLETIGALGKGLQQTADEIGTFFSRRAETKLAEVKNNGQ